MAITGPKRLDIKLGYTCNNNCRFCVAADKRCFKDQDTYTIKRDLGLAKKNGAVDVIFTGGEVTIRPDIFELISHARSLGYRIIYIQTNGRMFYYPEFCHRAINLGANSFSISVHGHRPEIHDYLTRAEGSFRQTVTGIRNLRDMSQTVMTNSVITKQNYRFLPEIAQYLIDLEVNQLQLAFPHANGNAYKNFDEIMPLKSDIVSYVHEAIDRGIDSGVEVMVEAYPFCFMKGYERYCSDRIIPPTMVKEISNTIEDFSLVRKKHAKATGPDCRECRYYSVCEGPWREYPERFGWSEFKPVRGEKITDLDDIR
jgi:MoaA/NifB/PqqE/SkfB family radical SAM enzyme